MRKKAMEQRGGCGREGSMGTGGQGGQGSQ